MAQRTTAKQPCSCGCQRLVTKQTDYNHCKGLGIAPIQASWASILLSKPNNNLPNNTETAAHHGVPIPEEDMLESGALPTLAIDDAHIIPKNNMTNTSS